jgi:hypothetical protein
MARGIHWGWLICLTCVGCATAPPLDNPGLLAAGSATIENPVLVSPGIPTTSAYNEVFEKAIEVLSDYFDLLPPNEVAGQIVTRPRIAPGYEQFWKPGNPDPRSRLLATLQTIRQTAIMEIRAGERGGFLVYVVVYRELEDLAKPAQARIGSPVFEEAATVARPFDIVNPDPPSDAGGETWFKVGRDYALEQVILARMRTGH